MVSVGAAHAGIATVAIVALVFSCIIAWFGYAYFFPHTWSGQILIKVRNDVLDLCRGE